MPDGSSHPSIAEAAGGLAGVSKGASSSVPYMLFNAVPRDYCMPDPSTASVVGTDEIEGRACKKIEGIQRGRRRAMVWIEIASGLLLKVESGSVFDDESRRQELVRLRERYASMGPDDPHRSVMEKAIAHFSESRGTNHRTEETTVWRPVLDQPIDSASLEFTPPAEDS